MAIYTSTMKKYFKSPSTWIIFIITFVLIIVLGGYVAFNSLPNQNVDPSNYAKLAIALVAGMTAFLAIFTSVFAGFKGATMFKDEVEDGSFLVLLSKPIRRSKIVLYKWFSLQSIIVLYTFFASLSFLIAIVTFDKGDNISDLSGFLGINSLKSKIIIISLFLWMILFVSSLIFSSIALLLSTKLSVGATIGISISLGVVIPVTSLVQVFTQESEWRNISTNWSFNLSSASIMKKIADKVGPAGATVKSLLGTIQKEFDKIKKYQTEDPYYMHDLAAYTGMNNGFKNSWYFDLNFQFNILSSFASEQIIPDEIKFALSSMNQRVKKRPGFNTFYIDEADNNILSEDAAINEQQMLYTFARTWEINKDIRQSLGKVLFTYLKLKLSDPSKELKVPSSLVERFKKLKITVNNKTLSVKNIEDYWNLYKELDIGMDQPTKRATKTAEELYETASAFWEIDKLFNGEKNEVLTEEEKSIIKPLSMMIINALYPAGLSITEWSMTTELQVKKLNLEKGELVDPKFIAKIEAPIKPDAQNTQYTFEPIENSTALKLISAGYSINDTRMALSLLRAGRPIKKVTQRKYTTKYDILWVYIGIAMFLLPLSFFVVRKQDFR